MGPTTLKLNPQKKQVAIPAFFVYEFPKMNNVHCLTLT